MILVCKAFLFGINVRMAPFSSPVRIPLFREQVEVKRGKNAAGAIIAAVSSCCPLLHTPHSLPAKSGWRERESVCAFHNWAMRIIIRCIR